MRLRIPKPKSQRSGPSTPSVVTPRPPLSIRALKPTPSQLHPDVLELAELIAELPAKLREQALTHYTWVKDDRDSYKRLAYIGDSLLALFVAEDLYGRFPNIHLGKLSMIRDRAVCGVSCGEVGRELGLPELLESLAEPKHVGAVPTEVLLKAPRPVAEMTEAMIGASRLTFGFERTRTAVLAAFERQIQASAKAPRSPKSMLHKFFARQQTRVDYEVVSKSGSDQAPKFQVAVVVDSERIGEGEGHNKKEAEHAAAKHALERLGTIQS